MIIKRQAPLRGHAGTTILTSRRSSCGKSKACGAEDCSEKLVADGPRHPTSARKVVVTWRRVTQAHQLLPVVLIMKITYDDQADASYIYFTKLALVVWQEL